MTKIALWGALTTLVALAYASPLLEKRVGGRFLEDVPASANLTWHPCPSTLPTSPPGLLCSRVLLPKDYANPSLGSYAIALVKQPALVSESSASWAGPLFYNPGGPGLDTTYEILTGGGTSFQNYVGGDYSIIGIDPRGTGQSEPEANCYDSVVEHVVESNRLLNSYRSIETGGISTAAEQIGMHEGLSRRCTKKFGGNDMRYVGTAAVARDLMAVSDMIWEKAQKGKRKKGLQYWGYSYGTVLGMYHATLFPDRVERMVLDGVVNPEGWSTTYENEVGWVEDVDGGLESFARYCATGTGCSMNPDGTQTKSQIMRRLKKFLDHIRLNPVVPGDTLIAKHWHWITTFIYGSLYSPMDLFPALSDYILYLENTALVGIPIDSFPTHITDFTGWGRDPTCDWVINPEGDNQFSPFGAGNKMFKFTKCSDRTKVEKITPQRLVAAFNKIKKVSDIGTIQIWNMVECSGLDDPALHTAVERLSKIGAKTSTPILFLGTTHDPVTPLSSAHTSSRLFPSSRVLEIQGTGHCSGSVPSSCAAIAIADYWRTGKLPTVDKCPADEVPFGVPKNGRSKGTVVEEVREEKRTGRKGRSLARRDGVVPEGAELLAAAEELGRERRKVFLRGLMGSGVSKFGV